MVDPKDEIVNFIKRNGPILPIQVSKEIGSNILLAGAILAELVSGKRVFITNTKKGGSPFYYVPGQENKLQNLAQFLSGKQKDAYDLIKNKKVIRDKIAEPWQRVALREIKDFAIPLNVTLETGTEIFWKWYMLNTDEAKNYIKRALGVKKEKEKEVKQKKLVDRESFIVKKKKENKNEEKVEKKVEGGEFFEILRKYFYERNISLFEDKVVRKNREFNFVVDIPSRIGTLRYFVKCKNKKTINDADLSLAFTEAQQKKLPVLFLSNGKLTKKAEKYIENNLKGQLTFKRIS